jgi:putative salt-induced outer membrane protein YdiY
MRFWIRTVAALGAISTIAPAATAQINVERLRSDLKKTPATATVQGSFTGRTGNSESVSVGAGAMGGAHAGRHGFFGSTQADYARFDKQTAVSKSFVHLRYDYALLDWLHPEAFVQQQQDKFQRLQLRELVGAGLRFIVADEEDLRLAIGTAYMLEYERISVAEGAADRPTTLAHRLSSYASTTWAPDSRVRMTGTLYAQPRLDKLEDCRVLFEAALTTDVTKRLAVTLLMTVRYDSEPPTTVKTTDAEVKNAFVLKF